MRRELERLVADGTFVFFDNAPDMIAWLRTSLSTVSLLCLDHDLGPNRERDGETFDPGVGRDVVNFLVEHDASCQIVIHSTNAPAADGMQFALRDAGWKVERVVPSHDLEWVASGWAKPLKGLWPAGRASAGDNHGMHPTRPRIPDSDIVGPRGDVRDHHR